MASKVKNRLAVLNVVGLTSDLLKRGLPCLNQLADQVFPRLIQPALPAVTYRPNQTISQVNLLRSTGLSPMAGIIVNWQKSNFGSSPIKLSKRPKYGNG